ncbi:MAG: class I SAM-dependent methyltransferase [Bacteroidales bacterium]
MKFDRAAQTYDADFTNTPIGRLQRNLVLSYVDAVLDKAPDLKILEFNAGTGEDAIHFAAKGYSVSATDISAKMLDNAETKAEDFGLSGLIQIIRCDMREIANQDLQMEYDIVFSNFGGLNCLSPSEIEKLSEDVLFLLKPGGRFIAVVMPQYCFWESLYFLLKGKSRQVFRRNTNESIPVRVEGETVKTWYYSPARFYRLMKKNFRKVKLQPIGFFIPPSYLGPAFDKKRDLLKFLGKLDRVIRVIPFLASYSDHFLIDLERVN